MRKQIIVCILVTLCSCNSTTWAMKKQKREVTFQNRMPLDLKGNWPFYAQHFIAYVCDDLKTILSCLCASKSLHKITKIALTKHAKKHPIKFKIDEIGFFPLRAETKTLDRHIFGYKPIKPIQEPMDTRERLMGIWVYMNITVEATQYCRFKKYPNTTAFSTALYYTPNDTRGNPQTHKNHQLIRSLTFKDFVFDLSDKHFRNALSKLKTLETLSLRNCTIIAKSKDASFLLNNLTELKKLTLYQSEFSLTLISGITEHKNLQKLSIDPTEFQRSVLTPSYISDALTKFPNLKLLSVSNLAPFTNNSFAFPHHEHLESIDIYTAGTPPHVFPRTALKSIFYNFPRLKYVYLQVGSHDITAVELPTNSNICELYVPGTVLSRGHIKAAFLKLKHLRYLDCAPKPGESTTDDIYLSKTEYAEATGWVGDDESVFWERCRMRK